MNLEIPKWAEAGAYIEGTPVKIRDYGYRNLTGQNAPHIKVLETKNLVRTYISPKGERILDFGQLMAGNASLALIGQPHAAVTLQYFEETDQEGNYWFELGGRNSQQTDTVILDENGKGIASGLKKATEYKISHSNFGSTVGKTSLVTQRTLRSSSKRKVQAIQTATMPQTAQKKRKTPTWKSQWMITATTR